MVFDEHAIYLDTYIPKGYRKIDKNYPIDIVGIVLFSFMKTIHVDMTICIWCQDYLLFFFRLKIFSNVFNSILRIRNFSKICSHTTLKFSLLFQGNWMEYNFDSVGLIYWSTCMVQRKFHFLDLKRKYVSFLIRGRRFRLLFLVP